MKINIGKIARILTSSTPDLYEDAISIMQLAIIGLEEGHTPAYALTHAKLRCIDELFRSRRHNKYTLGKSRRVTDVHFNINDIQSGAIESFIIDALTVNDIYTVISEDDHLLLSLMYEQGYTQRDVSKILNVSTASISIRHKKIINRLRSKYPDLYKSKCKKDGIT
jgi:RNA polymerase sigma factor (sigma-70 family)